MDAKSKGSNGGKKKPGVNRSERAVALGDVIWVKISRGSFWPAVVDDEIHVSEERKPQNKKSRTNVLVRLYGSYEYMYVDPVKCRTEFENVLEQNGDYREIFKRSLEKELPSSKSGKAKGKGSNSKAESNGEAVSKTAKKTSKKSNGESVSKTTKKTSAPPKSNENANKKTSSPQSAGNKRKSLSTDKQAKTKSKSSKSSKKDGVVGNSISNGADTDVITVELVDDLSGDALNPLSGKTLLAGCQALSARRMKVMQNLGLSPPLGSPFL